MSNSIRMNQIIQKEEDPELYEFLSRFTRGKPYQARKLMLLGLVQLERLNGVNEKFPASTNSVGIAEEDYELDTSANKNEAELIADAGLDELFG